MQENDAVTTAKISDANVTVAKENIGGNLVERRVIREATRLRPSTILKVTGPVPRLPWVVSLPTGLHLAAAQTNIQSIINGSLTKAGTAADQEYITFGTANEVNIFVNNKKSASTMVLTLLVV